MTALDYFRTAHNGYFSFDKTDRIITQLPINEYIILRAHPMKFMGRSDPRCIIPDISQIIYR